jgi:hypothetical protein
MTERVCEKVPPPQDAVHEPQLFQPETLQSMGQG